MSPAGQKDLRSEHVGDVVKNDSDAKRTDAYLTSETGKVYTMLAHASGRFDGA